ncbi:MAG: ankyrin repeat domain-containing protein, partial [Alphaproteobacteria bacterium]|nr:ankyrin repeat domain-containing protein [Alphaproteobacteria bacterium]
NGTDVNQPYNASGWTPFMWACKEFYETNMIKLFLEAGGDVSSRNKDGETPFMIAAKRRSSPSTLKLLLDAGSDINAQDNEGFTPFMNIVRHPQALMRLSILDFMIDNGANPNISNKSGKNVWDYAAEQDGMTAYLCVRLLKESCHD